MTNDQGRTFLRISKVADRYLIFDADHAALLRRSHNICGVLVGSTPQNPTQNVFLSLPAELFAEEAAILLKSGVAVLVDETSHHLDTLRSRDVNTRLRHMEVLRQYRRQAENLLAEDEAARTAQKLGDCGPVLMRTHDQTPTHLTALSSNQVQDELPEASLQAWAGLPSLQCPNAPWGRAVAKPMAVTPTASPGLPPPALKSIQSLFRSDKSSSSEFYRYLLSKGYFMTPGLRFGGDYSVYPGDPLRYHAHFLASEYEWHEEIWMLDIVGSGRLGTSVKKGFLIGGEDPGSANGGHAMRAFTIEWAGM
ncbi:hypothetical protein ACRALDRAFT_1059124 [Sodiomyces alcalophilus JCM 7366]|uniref:uncharacterized protein n=1 Tax=Sodiomyces alcalophilus JCM 7366 TaxID=591952 RepID=UPI0039B54F54